MYTQNSTPEMVTLYHPQTGATVGIMPKVGTFTVPLTTLKGYTLECYHEGFTPMVGDLYLYTQFSTPEGVGITLSTPEWVTLLRWYRKGYTRNYTRRGTHPLTGRAPYGLTNQGTVHDPLWDALLGRVPSTHPRYYLPR